MNLESKTQSDVLKIPNNELLNQVGLSINNNTNEEEKGHSTTTSYNDINKDDLNSLLLSESQISISLLSKNDYENDKENVENKDISENLNIELLQLSDTNSTMQLDLKSEFSTQLTTTNTLLIGKKRQLLDDVTMENNELKTKKLKLSHQHDLLQTIGPKNVPVLRDIANLPNNNDTTSTYDKGENVNKINDLKEIHDNNNTNDEKQNRLNDKVNNIIDVNLPKFNKKFSKETNANDCVLDKTLPTQFDLMRANILAEQSTDAQVAKSFELLAKVDVNDWQVRSFLMDIIEALVKANGDVSQEVLYENREIIKDQLSDLRSAIVRRSCEMVIALSSCLRTKFSQCLCYLIPTHLRGLYVTIAIISDSHNQSLTQCMTNTCSLATIPPLLKTLKENSKHCAIRIKVFQLIYSLLNDWLNCNGNNNTNKPDNTNDENNYENNKKKLEKYIDSVADAMKSHFTDANGEVRLTVKNLYEILTQHFPKQAKLISSKFQQTQLKMLRKPTATTASIDFSSHIQSKQQLTKPVTLNVKTMSYNKKNDATIRK